MGHDDTVNSLLFNYFLDMRKKDINKRQRARLLAKYLDDTGVSGRELARQLGIPKSTVQDWLLINNISESKYEDFKSRGFTDTDIYRMLRNNKGREEKAFDECMIREEIRETSRKLKMFINQGRHMDASLINELKELINVLNRILLHNERQF